jgi:hypothetical protein
VEFAKYKIRQLSQIKYPNKIAAFPGTEYKILLKVLDIGIWIDLPVLSVVPGLNVLNWRDDSWAHGDGIVLEHVQSEDDLTS